MGQVYRARDTRLDRDVAIKILQQHISAKPEILERFEREARAISSLNHPRICTLFDIGDHEGMNFLVMECLEGESLAERLRRGALQLKDVLRIGMEISEGLEVAHRAGIVHRDLKPANVMLTKTGAKLMDFGLAKGAAAGQTSAASAPLLSAVATSLDASPLSPLTKDGALMGTIEYMSPEQIEGKPADARSDIFALGGVLYEMVTGKRPFEGKSQVSVASAILEKDPPPISASQPLTPSAFEHVVNTCLAKSPEERYRSAHDVGLELHWIATDKSSSAVVVPKVSIWRRHLGWGVAAALALGLLAALLVHRAVPAARAIRAVINPPEKTSFLLTGDSAGPPVLSPDGSSLAFTAKGSDSKQMIWVRDMNSLDAHPVSDTEDAIFPFWSPDGHALGFFADSKLKTIDLRGGAATVLANANFGRGGTWGAGGVIVFSPDIQVPLMQVPVLGGTPVPVTQKDTTQHTSHRWPQFLPDGKHFLYVAVNHNPAKAASDEVYYASLDGKENRAVLHSESNAIYANGYLLFARSDVLMAQAFDASSGTLRGEPQIVAHGVMNDFSTWHLDASAAADGLLVFASGGKANLQLVWSDLGGKITGVVAEKIPSLLSMRLSLQGDRVAMEIDTGVDDIWVQDIARGVKTRLTFGPVSNRFPVWSPDGKWIAYAAQHSANRYALCRKLADGSGAEEELATSEAVPLPTDWSRDGKQLFYANALEGGKFDLWVLPLEGERKPRRLLQDAAYATLSGNGRWLAFVSKESGTQEVYVQGYGGAQGRWQVTVKGGSQPVWSKDGTKLFFADATYNVFSVPVKESAGGLQFGAPGPVISNLSAPSVLYDVSPDGKKILFDRVEQQVGQSVTVMTNFAAGLKK